MDHEYENNQHRLQSMLERERDIYHIQYQIRQPCQNRPNYELPSRSPQTKTGQDWSRFLRLTTDNETKYRFYQYPTTPVGQHDIAELPATALNSPTSSIATSSLEAQPTADEVDDKYIADISKTIADIEQVAEQEERNLEHDRTTLALHEQHLQAIRDQLSTLRQIREHVQEGRLSRDKGAYQNKSESTAQAAPNAKVTSFMKDYGPVPDLGASNPNEDKQVRRCKLGRPIGKELRNGGVDKYYDQWLCVKHANQSLFELNRRRI
ncbi:hypothetical protein CC86DRAFT_412797 [Ophiobolus disseminans]|uniref:Uncharacterized protein n=1 Tax=Ophiobolus disseminans TaxID=1469910 RepID=A0A6A6ZGV3_9PLEO|nr:hypothetical protein CC86DRAFT_412797 [Ophiobolus disseminans]